MVVLTAPLGIIGVTLFLLVTQMPFGFVALLGVIALSGIIMRNAVILLDQIEQDQRAGLSPWDAVISATVRRFRPIMLTALTAILAGPAGAAGAVCGVVPHPAAGVGIVLKARGRLAPGCFGKAVGYAVRTA